MMSHVCVLLFLPKLLPEIVTVYNEIRLDIIIQFGTLRYMWITFRFSADILFMQKNLYGSNINSVGREEQVPMSTKAGGAELPSYLKIIKQLDAQTFDFEMISKETFSLGVALWVSVFPKLW